MSQFRCPLSAILAHPRPPAAGNRCRCSGNGVVAAAYHSGQSRPRARPCTSSVSGRWVYAIRNSISASNVAYPAFTACTRLTTALARKRTGRLMTIKAVGWPLCKGLSDVGQQVIAVDPETTKLDVEYFQLGSGPQPSKGCSVRGATEVQDRATVRTNSTAGRLGALKLEPWKQRDDVAGVCTPMPRRVQDALRVLSGCSGCSGV